MFYQNLKYSLKILLRNKALIFWTFAFPIILGLFFNLAFQNIEKKEQLQVIDIAIINSNDYNNNKIVKESLNELTKGKNKLFNIKLTDEKTSKDLLKNNKIIGYLTFKEDQVNITVKNSGVEETILKQVLEQIQTNSKIINKKVEKEISEQVATNKKINYEQIYQNAISLLNKNDIKINNISNKNLSYTMIEYYTLIAMACLYGALISMFIINYQLPNMNSTGKRISASPINKTKQLISSLLSAYIVQIIGLLLLFLFIIFILKVDYGKNLLYVIITSLCGALSGLSLGVATSTLFKTNENAKTGIIIAITMLFCFLSGMMGITMKYIIDKNIPLLNMINPANMITDALYSLYYYNTFDRFYKDILSLLIFSFIMILISIKGLRRQKYDNI
jgi:ABC-2 type transport system permease protein